MRRYATMRRCATLKHKVLSGDASWKYFAPTRRTVAERRIYERNISMPPLFTSNNSLKSIDRIIYI